MSIITDLKFALRSLARVKGLALTVIVTLALGIGANAAIFSVVRGVLLRPLVNKDEDRLIYIRQTAKGIGADNAAFSVPEINDLRARVRTLTTFGDFSTLDFTMVGLGEPRVVRAGVVGGSYFDVMGLRPVRGRLLNMSDDGPQAAGAVVLTHRFWSNALASDPNAIGKVIRLGDRSATIVGVVEPSVPYPSQTEIIANIVTSPHHLDATMVHGRVHRMTELFGRLAPGTDLEAARNELRAVHRDILKAHPEAYPRNADFQIEAKRLRDEITSPARTVLLILLAASALVFVIACSNVANLILARSVRREGELAIRASLGATAGALRRTLLVESLLLCGVGAALGVLVARPMVAVLAQYASRFSVRALEVTVDSSLLWVGVEPRADRGGAAGVRAAPADGGHVQRRRQPGQRHRPHHLRHQPAPAGLCRHPDRGLVRAPGRGWHAADDADGAAGRRDGTQHPQRPCAARAGRIRASTSGGVGVLQGSDAAHHGAARRGARRRRHDRAVARGRHLRPRLPVLRRGLRQGRRRRGSARAVPDGVAGVLPRARRADHRGPRLHGRRPPRRRVGRHRQPEPGAADVLRRPTRSTAA